MYAPSKVAALPGVSHLLVIKTKHLKADSPSFLLKNSFDNIPQNLLNEEYIARQRLARTLIFQTFLEAQMEVNPSNKDYAVSAN